MLLVSKNRFDFRLAMGFRGEFARYYKATFRSGELYYGNFMAGQGEVFSHSYHASGQQTFKRRDARGKPKSGWSGTSAGS